MYTIFMSEKYIHLIYKVFSFPIFLLITAACDRASVYSLREINPVSSQLCSDENSQCDIATQTEITTNENSAGLPTLSCEKGSHLENGQCLRDVTLCAANQIEQNGICIDTSLSCLSPKVLKNGVCVSPTDFSCPSGLCSESMMLCLKAAINSSPTPIYNEAEFRAMQRNRRYVLQNDIRLNNNVPAVSNLYGVILEGNNHTISNVVQEVSQVQNGLFGNLHCTVIKDLKLSGVDIDLPQDLTTVGTGALAGHIAANVGIFNVHALSGLVSSSGLIGGLFGYISYPDAEVVIVDSSSTVEVKGEQRTASNAGGFGGGMIDAPKAKIINSTANGSVTGSYNTGGFLGQMRTGTLINVASYGEVKGFTVGGLVGLQLGGTINRSFSKSNVTNGYYAGGLVGYMLNDSSRDKSYIQNCYASGLVQPGRYNSYSIGGLVGVVENVSEGAVSNSYASGQVSCQRVLNCGGFLGSQKNMPSGISAVYNSFWNLDSSGIHYSATNAEVGLTSAQMTDANNFAGWDFIDLWKMEIGNMPTIR